MAGASGTNAAVLKAALLTDSRSFAFFQAVRLLKLLCRVEDQVPGPTANHDGLVKIRPKLSLAFPESDIDTIASRAPLPGYLVTANFLGLYGVSSPLPAFYTEDLIAAEQNDQTALRDLVDIIHFAFYPVFFEAWTAYRPLLRVLEEGDTGCLEEFFALSGIGARRVREVLPDPYELLRYTGLLTQHPRSGLGLKALLGDALGGIAVEVTPCQLHLAVVPEDQRTALGGPNAVIGSEAVVGEVIQDRMGAIRLTIGPVDRATFSALLPGGELCERLKFFTRFYLRTPLHCQVELVLEPGQELTANIGGDLGSHLGLDVWFFSGGVPEGARARFEL